MDQQQKSREEILAAIKAKADAIRAQRATAVTGEPSPKAAAPSATLETPVSAVNAAGRPAAKPVSPKIRALATVTQGVEIAADKAEDENLRKLLGGLGAYQNPLNPGIWQLDYRYYDEAKRRLTQAGYEIEEDQYGSVPLSKWDPYWGGWSKVEY
ncbi:MAG: hypothetical protein AUI83_00975 [Armatimonadetes bacterium 13_1_40CM_3_65_7]|uniref:Uncharacterized protein n=1 Tax=Candidatus Segetimicrobium genomatis TaxID=2569760 RepID=A0A537L818_9BACT|nr:MAG: hypothetical protein AUI83_00975 [Armatimonadetes bacterium 13_1_40CM_3_65_7]TMJ04165.1 MAG: hypothetical protein E6H01_04345 [Terrabacteria group bacterium ANGP1]